VFSLIAAEKTNYPVAVMCRVFGVDRTSFDDWERRPPSDRLELQSALFEYIEAFYNRQRRHSTLGMVSPAEYEQTQTTTTYSKIKQPTT
jgi:transposase InsO family protein